MYVTNSTRNALGLSPGLRDEKSSELWHGHENSLWDIPE